MDNQQVMRLEYNIVSKRGTSNTIRVFETYCEVLIYDIHTNYIGTVLIDPDVVEKVTPMRLNGKRYAYLCKRGNHAVHNVVMNHKSNTKIVVDHANGNPLDNRRSNLRIVTARDNASNRTRSPKNNTGVVGISRRSHPTSSYEYYRATVSDRSTPMSGAEGKTRQISKNFNINEYGEDLAFSLAKEWLLAMKTKFGYLFSANFNDYPARE